MRSGIRRRGGWPLSLEGVCGGGDWARVGWESGSSGVASGLSQAGMSGVSSGLPAAAPGNRLGADTLLAVGGQFMVTGSALLPCWRSAASSASLLAQLCSSARWRLTRAKRVLRVS